MIASKGAIGAEKRVDCHTVPLSNYIKLQKVYVCTKRWKPNTIDIDIIFFMIFRFL